MESRRGSLSSSIFEVILVKFVCYAVRFLFLLKILLLSFSRSEQVSQWNETRRSCKVSRVREFDGQTHGRGDSYTG